MHTQAKNFRVIQTQLPAEYIDLEKRVDALKQAHQKILAVTYALQAHFPPTSGGSLTQVIALSIQPRPTITHPISRRPSRTSAVP